MNKFESVLSDVEEKIRQLGEEKKDLSQKLAKANSERENMRSEISDLTAKLNQVSEKNKVIKMAKSLGTEESSADAKKRINQLVREIDKCIALLNK